MGVLYRRPSAAAGGHVQHGEVPAGEPGLFRDDRDSAAARAIVHAGGYGGFAVGSGDQRVDGARVLGRSGPVGKRLHFAGPTWRTVIGVVGDVLHEGLDGEAKAEMYMPVEQAPNIESGPTIVVRTSLEAGAAAAELKAAVVGDRSCHRRWTGSRRWSNWYHGIGGAAAIPHRNSGGVLDAGTRDGVDRDLWRDELPGDSAHARVRDPAERGSDSRADVLRLVLGRAAVMIGAGTCLGLSGSIFLARADREAAFWNRAARSIYLRGRAGVARRHCAYRKLCSGSASHASGPDDRVAI